MQIEELDNLVFLILGRPDHMLLGQVQEIGLRSLCCCWMEYCLSICFVSVAGLGLLLLPFYTCIYIFKFIILNKARYRIKRGILHKVLYYNVMNYQNEKETRKHDSQKYLCFSLSGPALTFSLTFDESAPPSG